MLNFLGPITELASGLIDRFFPPEATPEQRFAAQQALEQALAARDQAKAEIIVAEMRQGDNYTKRARPTVVYGGLVMIALNYVIFPVATRLIMAFGSPTEVAMMRPLLEPINLPTEFWVAWGGIVSTWVLGRSAEKKAMGGNIGKIASLITGGH